MQLVNQYKSFVVGNISWSEHIAKALGFKNADALTQAESNGKKPHLPNDVVEKLAHAHAEAYGEKYHTTIFYQQTSTGSWQFYSDEDCTRENRHDTATKQWQRNVGKYHKTTKPSRQQVAKQIDPIAKVAKSLRGKFSRVELKRLAKLIAE